MWYERNVIILSVYALLKVVKSHCDLSVMAVSLIVSKKNGIGF